MIRFLDLTLTYAHTSLPYLTLPFLFLHTLSCLFCPFFFSPFPLSPSNREDEPISVNHLLRFSAQALQPVERSNFASHDVLNRPVLLFVFKAVKGIALSGTARRKECVCSCVLLASLLVGKREGVQGTKKKEKKSIRKRKKAEPP